jgi:hypothetical protein
MFEESESCRSRPGMAWVCIFTGDTAADRNPKMGSDHEVSERVFRATLATGETKPTLDHSVLEGVEGDDTQSATGREHVHCGIEGRLELSEFVVDGHAQGLESAGSGVGAAISVTRRLGDAAGEGQRAGPWAAFQHCSGDAAGPGFFTKPPKNGDQASLVELVDEFSGIEFLAGIHSHVDGSIDPETESALRVVELGRTDSEVEEDAVKRCPFRCELSHVGEGTPYRLEPVTEALEPRTCGFQCRRVAIDADDDAVGSCGFEEGL